MGRQIQPCAESFLLAVRMNVSVYANDNTVFISRWSDIKAVKKVVKTYEEVAGAKINFDKSEGLRLGAWRGSVPLPGLFQLERNWLEVWAKVEAQVGTNLRRCLSLKGRVEVCDVYTFPLIFYQLSVLLLPKVHRLAQIQSLSKLLWSDRKPMVRRQVCCQCPRNGGLGMPDLESH